ncbi:hypothetical protein PRUPE_6G238000 [Prunus persica]|uniref:Uncharacterized protein n=1 Tax=Prunus persica TaxID=3760 RepID=M5WP59_PRUPE|nr:hypothetical protein PRUPE_6G238000 [Prunus persica]
MSSPGKKSWISGCLVFILMLPLFTLFGDFCLCSLALIYSCSDCFIFFNLMLSVVWAAIFCPFNIIS